MSRDTSFIFWTSILAVTVMTSAQPLHADNQTSDGYRIVPVKVGDSTVPIKVRDNSDPFKNVSSSSNSGKYDPERIFSNSSSMANKKFVPGGDAFTETASDHDQNTFVTRAYNGDSNAPTAPDLHNKAAFPAAGITNQTETEFNKSYFTTSSKDSHAAVLSASTAFADQNRTAVLGGSERTQELAANSMANKQYLGPGAQKVPDGVDVKDNITLAHIQDVPNRPLTVDEVRDLINHGFKPNTEEKPGEQSKPLNDPDYKPEPLRDTPAPASDDDKSDAVPPPGTMASPENSEPLPKP